MANNGITSHQLALASSQEDRLMRLESDLQDVAVSLAKIETVQNHIIKQADENSNVIISKLESLSDKFGALESRLTPLEQADRLRRAHQKSIKTLLRAALLALTGGAATAAGAWIWSLLTKVS